MGILVRSKAEGSAQITCAKPERKINVSMCLKKYFIACRLLPPQFWITQESSAFRNAADNSVYWKKVCLEIPLAVVWM